MCMLGCIHIEFRLYSDTAQIIHFRKMLTKSIECRVFFLHKRYIFCVVEDKNAGLE